MVHVNCQAVKGAIKISPRSVRNFKFNSTEPLLCKSKIFQDPWSTWRTIIPYIHETGNKSGGYEAIQNSVYSKRDGAK